MDRKHLDELDKSLLQIGLIGEAVQHQVATITSLMNHLTSNVSLADFFSPSIQILDICSSLRISSAELERVLEISSGVFESLKGVSALSDTYTSQINLLTGDLSLVGRRMVADFAAISMSAFNLSSLGVFDELAALFEFHEDSVEAFKSAGWTIAPSMSRELRERVVDFYQRNMTRHISQLIVGYYRKNGFEKLNGAIAAWETNPLFTSRMHIFKAALKAHCEKTYTLSVPALLPQIEGILNEYVKVNKIEAKLGKINMVCNAVLGNLGEYSFTSWAIVNTLRHQLQTNTYTSTDFEIEFKKSARNRKATRHTVLHGIATDYDKPINSLKAFVMLDAMSCLLAPHKDGST